MVTNLTDIKIIVSYHQEQYWCNAIETTAQHRRRDDGGAAIVADGTWRLAITAQIASDTRRALWKGILHALGGWLHSPSQCITGWQTHCVECDHKQQSPLHPASQQLGDDLRFRRDNKWHGSMRWARQSVRSSSKFTVRKILLWGVYRMVHNSLPLSSIVSVESYFLFMNEYFVLLMDHFICWIFSILGVPSINLITKVNQLLVLAVSYRAMTVTCPVAALSDAIISWHLRVTPRVSSGTWKGEKLFYRFQIMPVMSWV